MELATAAIVTALVQGLKTSLGIPGKWNFLLAIVLGVGLSVLTVAAGDEGLAGVEIGDGLTGLMVGLTASGLYAGAPTAVKKKLQ